LLASVAASNETASLISEDDLPSWLRAFSENDTSNKAASADDQSWMLGTTGEATADTVAENLAFYGGIYGLRGVGGHERVAEVVAFLGIAPRRRQLVGQLSGGWKQRLALGCALLHRPAVLFLDEPTAGVDPAARRAFWEAIHDLARTGTTILVTTHYMDEAERCGRLAMMSGGRLIALGTPAQVAAQVGGRTLEDAFIILQGRDER